MGCGAGVRCFGDSCVRKTRPLVLRHLYRAGVRGASNCNASRCYTSTHQGVTRTYKYPRTRMRFVIKNARAGTAIVATLLHPCRKIVTTRANRVGRRRTKTIRTKKRGILTLPRRRKGLSTTRMSHCIATFCRSPD